MSEKFKAYKRKLRWKSSIRKEGGVEDPAWAPEGWDEPAIQHPADSYLEARHGPWRAVWNGGRLADIHHDEGNGALDCMQVGNYDWQRGQLSQPPTPESLRQRLQQWAEESGDDYTRNALPYQ